MENIKLKGIQDIPVIEQADEQMHLMGELNGQYVRVPSKQAGGGSSDALHVMFTVESLYDDETASELYRYSCNKTYDEIVAAWGNIPVHVIILRKRDAGISYSRVDEYYFAGEEDESWFYVRGYGESLLYYPDGYITEASME